MRKFVLAVDIGGTNIKLGLVDPKGQVFFRTNLSTISFVQSKTKLIRAVIACLQKIISRNGLSKRDILGIGIGLPGLIDTRRGVVHFLVNIPRWKDVPLKRIIEKELRIPTFIDNDANIITLGEWKFGAGKGIQNMVCITLGTGVGGGLIIDGKLYRGEGFSAGEIGHIPINETGPRCNCGGYGCLESYAGNRRLLKRARAVFKNQHISLEEITRLASRGNKTAICFWNETAVHLGNGLTGVVNLLNPRCIVIGGGVANARQHLFKTIRQIIKRRAVKISAKMVKVVNARLGDDAGIIGAQVLVKDALSSR